MKSLILCLVGMLGVLLWGGVSGAWQLNGVPICIEPNEQSQNSVVSDGRGGAIFLWADERTISTNFNAYIQRVDQNGNPLWTVNGVRVCPVNSFQPCTPGYSLVSDGQGGAIAVWSDYRNGSDFDIYAQRVDSLGNLLWTTNGVPLCTATGHQNWPVVLSDGAGGAMVAWLDNRAGGGYSGSIYAQRINSSGVPLWTANGIQVSALPAVPDWPPPEMPEIQIPMTNDGSGGFIVAWPDNRTGNLEVYAQRVAANGSVLWTPSGNLVCTAPGVPSWVSSTRSGNNGATIVWTDNRAGILEIYAQRLDSTGAPRWALNGIPIRSQSDTTGLAEVPRAADDGAGGAIVAWADQRNPYDYDYAQRVDSSGARLWSPRGVRLASTPYPSQGVQGIPEIIPDGAGGAIATFWVNSYPPGSGTEDIYAQRLDSNGNLLWGTTGLVLCNAPDDQMDEFPALSESGQAIVVWEDYRNRNTTDMDIYAQSTKYLTTGVETPVQRLAGLTVKDLELKVSSPVVRSLALSYTLPKPGFVGLALYDAEGRRLENLFEGAQGGGLHEMRRTLSLPGGVYFVRLEAGGETITRKTVVVR